MKIILDFCLALTIAILRKLTITHVPSTAINDICSPTIIKIFLILQMQ